MAEQKQHRHLIAKGFLVIGLIDVGVTVLLLMLLWVQIPHVFVLRFCLFVVLPTLFIAGVFDKQRESG